jgi:hypothetical protein
MLLRSLNKELWENNGRRSWEDFSKEIFDF